MLLEHAWSRHRAHSVLVWKGVPMHELILAQTNEVAGVLNLGSGRMAAQDIGCVWSRGAVCQILIRLESLHGDILELPGHVERLKRHTPLPFRGLVAHPGIFSDTVVTL